MSGRNDLCVKRPVLQRGRVWTLVSGVLYNRLHIANVIKQSQYQFWLNNNSNKTFTTVAKWTPLQKLKIEDLLPFPHFFTGTSPHPNSISWLKGRKW